MTEQKPKMKLPTLDDYLMPNGEIKMDIYDYKLLVNALNEFRNQKIKENIDVEIIDELLMKLLQAPIEKERFKKEHCISAR